MSTPRSRAFSLDRVDMAAVGVNFAKLAAATAVVVLPMLAAGFDTNTTIGAVSVLIVRQLSELAARFAKNNG